MSSQPQRAPAAPIPPRRHADLSDAQIVQLIETFHAAHLADLAEAVRLARIVQARHGADGAFPPALADHLAKMLEELTAHQHREETALFPLILSARGDLLNLPIAALGSDHDDFQVRLETLVRMTRDYAAPPQACRTWQALYDLCRKFDGEFREHLMLEERALFPRFS